MTPEHYETLTEEEYQVFVMANNEFVEAMKKSGE